MQRGIYAQSVIPHNSFNKLVTTNGFGASMYDIEQNRITKFWNHIYRFPEEGKETLQLCYDTYPGIRIDTSESFWLGELSPSKVQYINGTNIIMTEHNLGRITIVTYYFSPFGVQAPSLMEIVEVKNNDTVPHELSIYFLFNFRVGVGMPDTSPIQETITWMGDYWLEEGDSGVMVYYPIEPPTHRSSSPDNPYQLLKQGRDLTDNNGTGGTFDDAVAGFQFNLPILQPRESFMRGVLIYYGKDRGEHDNIRAFIREWINNKSSSQILQEVIDEWEEWHKVEPELVGLEEKEKSLYKHSTAILRMGQVREGGRGYGQIVACLPPGRWNIAWVRDMCYAIDALIKSGHKEEAKSALKFVLEAGPGEYVDYVGMPYRVSITRYYGNGREESDWNEFGPNIEFDGFGLYLWVLSDYIKLYRDSELISYWDRIKAEIADVLVALVELDTGLIKADSSIWEVHWNGREKHFSYTNITAVRGLCGIADLASMLGDEEAEIRYRSTARRIAQSIIDNLRDDNKVIVQSLEEYRDRQGYYDAAVVEAITLGIIDPLGVTATSTLDAILLNLRTPSGRGFFRNDDGGWYDSQEWVFVDLRLAMAFRLNQRESIADDLIEWITEQSSYNYNLIAELYDPYNGDYRGEVPMVGFGSGAYIIAVWQRVAGVENNSPCGFYPSEESVINDGGVEDGSNNIEDSEVTEGCNCRATKYNNIIGIGSLIIFYILILSFFLTRIIIRN